MEEELKCPSCRQFLKEPILLQCAHSYCRQCAIKSQHKISASSTTTIPLGNQSGGGGSDTISLCVSDPDQDNSDKLSVVSETDSGVILCSTGINSSSSASSSTSGANSRASRPSSFVGSVYGQSTSARLPSILTPSTSGCTLICETCHKPSFYADENVLKTQPENIVIKKILTRLRYSPQPSSSSNCNSQIDEKHATPPPPSSTAPAPAPNCQWCEGPSPRAAELCCEVCGYYYCTPCQSIIHPPRGPLKDHILIPASTKRLGSLQSSSASSTATTTSNERKCDKHFDEFLTMFCTSCRIPVCCHCVQEFRHTGHEMQSIQTAVKSQKNDLSKTLQQLSEKAKCATEEISKLKQLNENITKNCEDFKTNINLQIDALIEQLQERRQRLLEFAEAERDSKKKALKSQTNRCTNHLNKTTALVHFCIEVLKEPDAVAYLQIGQQLSNRVSNQDFGWHKDMRTKAEVDPEFVLSLDTRPMQNCIANLDFAQLKASSGRAGRNKGDPTKVPLPPQFDATECLAENNSVTVVWHSPSNGASIDGYILEIDSGRDDGNFKEVYSGIDNICTIDGLHFDTIYNVRVKAFNSAGESLYSDPIGLQTAHVAWFQLTKSSSQRDVILSNNRATFTCTSLDYQVVLGTVSFSRGLHYWEITVDEFYCNGDIVVGVAQPSVNRSIMLGQDPHGWAMYIDDQRLWLNHNKDHKTRFGRGHGGNGSVIGVLMDCDQGTLSYYVNDRLIEANGKPYAFENMPRGLYYPAFCVNKNAKITVHTGLLPPSLRRSSNSDDSVSDTL